MRQERALPPSVTSCLEIESCDQIESKPARRPIRKASTFPPPKRRLSLSICGAQYRHGIPFRPRTCRAPDLVVTLETNNFGCHAFSERCPMEKASVGLRARANQRAMVREAHRRAFPLRLAVGRGAKQSRPPNGITKG